LDEKDVERIQQWVDEDWEKYAKLSSNNASDFAPYA